MFATELTNLGQLLERCTGIAKVTGSNPVQVWMFFSGLIFTTAQVVFITAKISYVTDRLWLFYTRPYLIFQLFVLILEV